MPLGMAMPENITMMIRRAVKAEDQNVRIVYFGGGGGSEAVLRGLSHLAERITAVIAVSDDGGDSGHLREGLGWAPGDIRRALIALAPNVRGQLAQLFCMRLDSRFAGRAGQCFGNMLFAAAAQSGLDMAGQIDIAARLLGVSGQVYPATYETVGLVAEMVDGRIVHGESAIAAYPSAARRVRLNPEKAAPPSGALDAIAAADAIVVGPGSVVTSLIPALLPSMEAIAASRAARFLVINAWHEGDHDVCSAAGYVRLIAGHLPGRRLFDCVIVHQPAEGTGLASGAGRRPVKGDLEAIRSMGFAAVGADLLGPDNRHDGARVASLVARLTPRFSRQASRTQPAAGESVRNAPVRNILHAQGLLDTRRTPCPTVKRLLCHVRRRRAATASAARRLPSPRTVKILRRQLPTCRPAPPVRRGRLAGRSAQDGHGKPLGGPRRSAGNRRGSPHRSGAPGKSLPPSSSA